ncbi:MAG: hypothetical protein ACYC99_17160 [Candidatus Geothermincolia bacterium]
MKTSTENPLPEGAIDFAIPHIKRKPFLSNDIEYWGFAVSGGSLYIYVKSRRESVTRAGIAIDDSVDDIIDVIRGKRRRKAVTGALEVGIQGVLAISDYWHLMTPAEIAAVRIKRRVFHFRIVVPEIDGRKKFSLLARSKYRKEFAQYLEAHSG